jgi:hypothetical protein
MCEILEFQNLNLNGPVNPPDLPRPKSQILQRGRKPYRLHASFVVPWTSRVAEG